MMVDVLKQAGTMTKDRERLNVCDDLSQLICTVPQKTSWHPVWSSCFAWVNGVQGASTSCVVSTSSVLPSSDRAGITVL